MRILMLTCHPTIRGPFPKILPLLASALRAEGCHVVEEPWGRHREEETFFEKIFGRIGDLVRIWRRLRREKFDVMVIQTATELRNYARDIPAAWLARRFVPHVAVQFHGSTPEMALQPGHALFRWASRKLVSLTDGMIVSSSEEQREWQKFYPGVGWFTTRNPFSPVELKPAGRTPASPWSFSEGTPLILFVGRLIVAKGVLDLVDAISHLGDGSAFHLLMIGSGAAEEELKTKVQQLRLTKKITIAGHVDEWSLQQAYRAASLFVLPSWSEGLPTVLLEAMDAGLPIVTTRIRGAADYLEEDVHASLVEPRAPLQLAAAIEKVINNPALRARMGEANRENVKKFAPEAVARQYIAILNQITGTASGLTPHPSHCFPLGTNQRRDELTARLSA